MIYEKSQELAQLSNQDWLQHDLFSFGWFLMLAVVAACYIIWFILLDKKRAVSLLLIGSLAAIWYSSMNILIQTHLGLNEYVITLTPVKPEIFTGAVTLGPIITMLVEQYVKTWKGYALWGAVGVAFIYFVLLPVYSLAGIFKMHRGWNYFYGFLLAYAGAFVVRVVYRWIMGTQKRHAG